MSALLPWGAADPDARRVVRRYLAPWQLVEVIRALASPEQIAAQRSTFVSSHYGAAGGDIAWSTTPRGIEATIDGRPGLVRWGTLFTIVREAAQAQPDAVDALRAAVRAHREHTATFVPCPRPLIAGEPAEPDAVAWWRDYGQPYYVRSAELYDAQHAAVASLWSQPVAVDQEPVGQLGQLDLFELLEVS